MSTETPGPSLSAQFAALIGYDAELRCTLARYSEYPCDGGVVMRCRASCCGREIFTCTAHRARSDIRQAMRENIDPVCGRRNEAPVWVAI